MTLVSLREAQKEMKHIEVDKPNGIKMPYKRSIIRPHRCYEMAQKLIYENFNGSYQFDGEVVYIYCLWTNFEIEHAVVEINKTIIYDGVFGRFYNKSNYYEMNNIIELLRKSPEQVKNEHLGAWGTTKRDWIARNKYMKKKYGNPKPFISSD